MRISDIQIGKRYRKDMGDIEELARSIDEVGLLQPVVVTPDGTLIAGQRRILACLMLGWQDIPTRVIDLDSIVRGEFAENEIRKDFTPSVKVAIGQALEPLERAAAKERQGKRSDIEPSENFTGSNALDRVADSVGMSRPTYTKAKAVVDAAEREPEKYGALLDQMDNTGNVSRAYKDMMRVDRIAEHTNRVDSMRDKVGGASHVSLYGGDMLDVLPSLGTFDLVVTDPPYGIDYNEVWDSKATYQPEQWLAAILPHLASQYNLFWFCAPALSADMERLFGAFGIPIQSRIVWHRRNMSMGSKAKSRFIDSWEMILHAGTRDLNFPEEWSDAWFDVQTFAVPQTNFTDRKLHPTQKPEGLIRRLVAFGSYPGDVILDPFAGSGTTGAVCPIDRACVLIEKQEEYQAIIEARLGL